MIIISASLYDDSIVNTLRYLFDDDTISISTNDNYYEDTADMNETDNFKLPRIGLTRNSFSINTDNLGNFRQIFTGSLVHYNEEVIARMQVIPIRLSYQLDIYTETRLDNDNFLREIIFYFTQHPTYEVKIPYGLDIEHKYNIRMDPEIIDNSDLPNHRNTGRIYRSTISLYIDDAYLFKSSIKRRDKLLPENISTVFVERGGD